MNHLTKHVLPNEQSSATVVIWCEDLGDAMMSSKDLWVSACLISIEHFSPSCDIIMVASTPEDESTFPTTGVHHRYSETSLYVHSYNASCRFSS